METLFSALVIRDMNAHIMNCFPDIAIGFIGDGVYWNCGAVKQPKNRFHGDWDMEIRHPRFAELRDKRRVQFLVYSRPFMNEYPNINEMQAQLTDKIPWIYCYTNGKEVNNPIIWGDGSPILPLLGRPYRYGITDCYSLVHDYFRLECGIKLAQFPRNWEFWTREITPTMLKEAENMFIDNFAGQNFVHIHDAGALESMQIHDVLLFAMMGDDIYNHAAVYIGNGKMMHHLGSKIPVDFRHLSKIVNVETWTSRFKFMVMRHKNYLQ